MTASCGGDQRQRPEDRVAQAARLRLHHVGDGRRPVGAAVVSQDVRLAGRDHEADLVGAAVDHALDEVFADRARTLDAAGQPAADRQQLLRERERLDAAAAARRPERCPTCQTSAASRLARSYPARAEPIAASKSSARCAAVCSASDPLARALGDALQFRDRRDRARRRPLRSSGRPGYRAPGAKKASRPSHQSDRIGAPQAAASNSRPDGH